MALAPAAKHLINWTAFQERNNAFDLEPMVVVGSLIPLRAADRHLRISCGRHSIPAIGIKTGNFMPEPQGKDLTRYAMAINLAITLAEAGNLAEATKLLFELVEEFSEAASAHGYLGWFLSQLGRHKEAIEQSSHAIRLAPESERASFIHFEVLWEAGKRIEALDEMKRLLKVRPSQVYEQIIKKWQDALAQDE